jgi:single-strand DNA-binding protein
MDLNKAMIIGRLTRDPEMRSTPQGVNVTSFAVATNSRFGQKDQVEYHNIVAWRKLGEIANQYLKKGSQVYIEGRIQSRTWQGNDGQQKNRTEIVADNMIMLGSAGGRNAGGASGAQGGFAGNGDSVSSDSGNGGPAGNDSQGDFLTEEMPTIQQGEQNGDEEITVEDIPF